jgi:hypothetical protein
MQTVRQAQMQEDSKSYWAAPQDWEWALIGLAGNRIMYYRKLIEKLRKQD